MLANHLCSLAHGLVYGTTTAVKGWQYSLHQNRPDSILHSWEDSDSTAACTQQMSTIDTWGDSANVELSSLTCNSSGHFQMLGNFVTRSGSGRYINGSECVQWTQDEHTPNLCCSMNNTYIWYPTPILFPRNFPPSVLQATVGGGEDLGMRLLLCKMYVRGKR